MRIFESLSFKNLVRRPGRTAAQVVLAVFLSFCVFGGTLVIQSLQAGLSSLEQRLGADIMVVPGQAASQSDLENIVLQGNTGYFYMDQGIVEKIKAREGVERVSTQLFLASASAGCCSVSVQIIGFDPETDFTVMPWIKKSYGKELKDMDIVVGNDLNAFVGDTLTFYGRECHVAAKLERTGTSLDTAVYTNMSTIKHLIEGSLEKKLNDFTDLDVDHVVSCVLVDVQDGYSVEEVAGDMNVHLRRVEAVQTKNMISGISQSLKGISDIAGILIGIIWILSLGIMIVAYLMIARERIKEFAVLRVMGASRRKLSFFVLTEGFMISFLGSVLGIALGFCVVFPFSNLIESELSLPFLIPGVSKILLLAVMAFVVSVLTGSLTSAIAARHISRLDTGTILREGNG